MLAAPGKVAVGTMVAAGLAGSGIVLGYAVNPAGSHTISPLPAPVVVSLDQVPLAPRVPPVAARERNSGKAAPVRTPAHVVVATHNPAPAAEPATSTARPDVRAPEPLPAPAEPAPAAAPEPAPPAETAPVETVAAEPQPHHERPDTSISVWAPDPSVVEVPTVETPAVTVPEAPGLPDVSTVTVPALPPLPPHP